jgi:hypothetical protein
MNEEWERAYPPGSGRWMVIAWEAAGLAYLHWTTVRLFDLAGAGVWVLAAVFAVAWAAGSWQVTKMGLYLSRDALRIRGVFRTRTLVWAGIERVTVEDVHYWRVPAGKSVILTTRAGERVDAAMWEQGMDFHRRPREFRAVCQELRRRVDASSCRATVSSTPARSSSSVITR